MSITTGFFFFIKMVFSEYSGSIGTSICKKKAKKVYFFCPLKGQRGGQSLRDMSPKKSSFFFKPSLSYRVFSEKCTAEPSSSGAAQYSKVSIYPKVSAKAASSVYLSIEFTKKNHYVLIIHIYVSF